MRLIKFCKPNSDGYGIGECSYFTEWEAHLRIDVLQVAVDAYTGTCPGE